MSFASYNANTQARRVGDCVIRAISKATGQDWDATYVGICAKGFELCDMPSSNYVWGEYLKDHGFHRELAPDGLTVAEFAERYRHGTYVLAISGHVVCVKDGNYYDTWQSGDEVPIYAWVKE